MHSEKCLTPNGQWTTKINWNSLSVKVVFPESLVPGLSEAQAQELENDVHDGVATIIARHRNKGGSNAEIFIQHAALALERQSLQRQSGTLKE